MRYLGFVPARAGSKGIPQKNLALLAGQPLIWHTLQAALGSSLRDSVFLSSDSDEIIEFTRRQGVAVNYKRPAQLATDKASTVDAVLHALEFLRNDGRIPHAVVLLQPTSPLRTAAEIDRGLAIFEEKNLDSLVGVNRLKEHPYESIESDQDGSWHYLRKPLANATRRQDYEDKFFYINGALYIVKTEYLMKNKCFVREGESFLYEMSPGNSIDIDEPLDLCMAEAYYRFSEQGRIK